MKGLFRGLALVALLGMVTTPVRAPFLEDLFNTTEIFVSQPPSADVVVTTIVLITLPLIHLIHSCVKNCLPKEQKVVHQTLGCKTVPF
ncbi:MAG: hypothetical protein M1549_02550 [Candidatus Dependentiae bacterium]|jgi:hypothetical protein|nr:hypothetical protein [Candidatus Dependentiae bacterium]